MASFLLAAAGFVLAMVALGLLAVLRRPAEVDHLIGNPSKARQQLAWEPSVDFSHLVKMMVDADRERLKSGRALG